jgi:hypothetical protein
MMSQMDHRFEVIGLGEHVERLEGEDAVGAFRECVDITRESGRVAGDDDDV